MKRTCAVVCVLVVLCLSPRLVAEEIFRDDFSGEGALRWRAIAGVGDWEVVDGKYVNTTEQPFTYRWTVADVAFTQGEVEVDALIGKEGLHGCTSMGIVAKYIDDDNYWRVQLGTYGRLNLRGKTNGEAWSSYIRRFRPEVGKPYHLRILWRAGDVGVYVNEKLISVVTDPFPNRAGKPGLYTATVIAYDNFVVRSAQD